MFDEDADSRMEPSRGRLLFAAAALTPAVAAVGPLTAMAQAEEDRERLIGRAASAAGEPYAARPGLLRSRDMSHRKPSQPLRRESVTHVSGMNRHLCDRNGSETG